MVRRLAIGFFTLLGLAAAAVGVYSLVAPAPSRAQDSTTAPSDQASVARGRALFATGCADCHGMDARGIPHQGPNLHGVGAQAPDFYLRTGRMPLAHPQDEPVRQPQTDYSPSDVDDLVAYIASLKPGPPVPQPDAQSGSLAEGKHLFTLYCAGCHQVVGQAGLVPPGTTAPSLQQATAVQIAEAVRIGPYLMPKFDRGQIDDRELDSIIRFVASTRHLDNRGGWGIGNIGPIPEGMVTWLVAVLSLVMVARLIGERTP